MSFFCFSVPCFCCVGLEDLGRKRQKVRSKLSAKSPSKLSKAELDSGSKEAKTESVKQKRKLSMQSSAYQENAPHNFQSSIPSSSSQDRFRGPQEWQPNPESEGYPENSRLGNQDLYTAAMDPSLQREDSDMAGLEHKIWMPEEKETGTTAQIKHSLKVDLLNIEVSGSNQNLQEGQRVWISCHTWLSTDEVNIHSYHTHKFGMY